MNTKTTVHMHKGEGFSAKTNTRTDGKTAIWLDAGFKHADGWVSEGVTIFMSEDQLRDLAFEVTTLVNSIDNETETAK